MPSNIPATTIRIDPEVKREATAILDELGLSDLERIAPLPDLSPARGRLFCNLRI